MSENEKPAWRLCLSTDGVTPATANQRRKRTTLDGKPRLSASHAVDFFDVMFADRTLAGIADSTERAAHNKHIVDALDRLANVKVATTGGASGGCPKLVSGIWRGVSGKKDSVERAENIKWMLARYEQIAATKNGRKAVREMLRDAEIVERIKIPGGVQSLSDKRVDAIKAACEDALRTP